MEDWRIRRIDDWMIGDWMIGKLNKFKTCNFWFLSFNFEL